MPTAINRKRRPGLGAYVTLDERSVYGHVLGQLIKRMRGEASSGGSPASSAARSAISWSWPTGRWTGHGARSPHEVGADPGVVGVANRE